MFSDEDANKSARNLRNAVGFFNRRIAFTGRASDGSATAGLEAGYIWVRPIAGGETRAKNAGVVSTKVPNTPVEIGENTRTGELEVIRVAPEAIYTLGANLTGRAATPDVTPEHFAGTIPADALQDLRVRPPDPNVGGLNVCIEAGWTQYGYHAKEHRDISAYLPVTVGTRWWVISYLDVDGLVYFSTAQSVETTQLAEFLVQSVASIPVNVIPVGAYPLYAFILEEGQTEVTATNTVFVDIRLHFAQRGLNTDSIMTDGNYEVVVDGLGNVVVEG